MLTRRGFVSCALCAATGFAATGADAQMSGAKLTILNRVDGPVPGYETVEARVEAPAGAVIAKHTHPGVETTFIIEGSQQLEIAGQDPKTYSAGESFQIPTGVVHGSKIGDKPIVNLNVYVVEKGKPLVTPA
jgi:quercetin dioxygenase-like cupin family protein